MKKNTREVFSLPTLGVGLTLVLLSGCASSEAFGPNTPPEFGNAVNQNIAVHTAYPDAPYSGNQVILMNGDRAHSATQRYREGKVIQPKILGLTEIGGEGE